MNFSVENGSEIRVGVQFNGSCLDLSAAFADQRLDVAPFTLLEDVIASSDGLAALERQLAAVPPASLLDRSIPMSRVRPRPPVFRPQKIIGIGLNYRDHAAETGMARPEEPLLFAMFANAIIGDGEAIVIPEMSKKIDFEAELGVVIGRRGRHIPVDRAIEFVAGYTIVNDVSARDLQFADRQWIRGKTFDTFAPMGPCLASTSALGDADGLHLELRLNGAVMQDSNTRNLLFKVPELVSYISRVMTLEPGDVIATGTPAGVGYARKPPVYLQPGDTIEIKLEGVGVLRNTVA